MIKAETAYWVLWLDSYVLKEASNKRIAYVGYTYSEASRKDDRGHECQR